MRLSTNLKYRLCQLLFAVGFFLTLTWVGQLGLGFSPHHLKVSLIGLVVTITVTVPFAVGFYYYRAKVRKVNAATVEVETLASVGTRVDVSGQKRGR